MNGSTGRRSWGLAVLLVVFVPPPTMAAGESGPTALSLAEMQATRGGVSIQFTFPPPNQNAKGDNIRTTVHVDSMRAQSPETVFFYHGSTKTKSQSIALTAPDWEGDISIRVPLMPSTNDWLSAAYLGDCDMNPSTPDAHCVMDNLTSMRIDTTVEYHKVHFHNTRSPLGETTVFKNRDAQRMVDDEFWTLSTNHMNVDWIYGACPAADQVTFGLEDPSSNWEASDNISVPIFQVPWVSHPTLGLIDCSAPDNTIIPDTGPGAGEGLDFSIWDSYCAIHFSSRAASVDPQRKDLHVFFVRDMPLDNTFQVGGFVRGVDEDVVILHDDVYFDDDDAGARTLAHEIGHTLDLFHPPPGDPLCASGSPLMRKLMCGPEGVGMLLTSTECQTSSANTQHVDYN